MSETQVPYESTITALNLYGEYQTHKHFCSFRVHPDLRWLVTDEGNILQQGHVCAGCGNVEWRAIPLVSK